jgi:hypothetical protein
MNIYLDVNDTLLTHDLKPASGLKDFIVTVLKNNDVYWLTTHCKGNSQTVMNYLSPLLSPDILAAMKRIKPTNWNTLKTEAIDFSKEFLWFDDYLMEAEKKILRDNNQVESLMKVDLRNNPYQLIQWLESNVQSF